MNVSTLLKALLPLSKYHPVFIEGMGYYDPRDPEKVATVIHDQLLKFWDLKEENCNKPKIIVVQGDPLHSHGISAITPRVAELLQTPRCLVVLDAEIADYHSPNADRDNVVLEYKYSQMVSNLEPSIMSQLEEGVDDTLAKKNSRREAIGKPPLKDYFRHFALLQEVTKASCHQICGDITVVHTAKRISEFSVTSFCEVGLELGLVENEQMVPYPVEDDLDFETIDKR